MAWPRPQHRARNPATRAATAAAAAAICSPRSRDFSCRVTAPQAAALAKRLRCEVHAPLQLVAAISDFQRINLSHLNEKKREEMPHSLSPSPEKTFF